MCIFLLVTRERWNDSTNPKNENVFVVVKIIVMVVVVVVGSIIVMNATKNKMTIVRNLVDNGGSIVDFFAVIVILVLFLAFVTFAAILSLLFCLFVCVACSTVLCSVFVHESKRIQRA